MTDDEKKALAPHVNRLEAALAAIPASFECHLAQKNALKTFWDGLGAPAPQLPLNGQEKGKKQRSKR